MRGRDHLILGAALGAGMALAVKGPTSQGAIGIMMPCILGSIYPDIDLPDSTLGFFLRPLSEPLNHFFGHRGFVHSPLHLFLLACLFNWILSPLIFSEYLVTSFVIGYLAHLIQDTFTRGGVPWLWPFNYKFHFSDLSSNNPIWSIGTAVVSAVILALALLRPSVLNNCFMGVYRLF